MKDMSGVSAARAVAFRILLTVEGGQSHSDELLRGKAVTTLSPADRNLATALVLGVLRWQIRLDQELRALLKHPNAKLDAEVLVALRLGAFQLLHMDRIPARAAIDESVELAKRSGHRFASGMVNAVLRKLAALDRASQIRTPDPCALSAVTPADIALAHAHPAWMVERWVDFFGAGAACQICRHGQDQPVPAVRLASPEVEAELVAAGIALEPADLLSAARTVLFGDVTATAAFREGRVRLQDEGSQLAAEIAGQGSAILDCCAAPGGKTLILAEQNPQARIVACESSAPRLAALRHRLAVHPRIECRHADATALEDDAVFDLVLADVPCSGSGTLGRNPEIRHRLQPADFVRQAERQHAILRAALRAVRPGGRVLYSTCSLEPEEDEQVVAEALSRDGNAHQLPLEARIRELASRGILTPRGADQLRAALTPEGALRLIPGAFPTDGFFIAMLERTA